MTSWTLDPQTLNYWTTTDTGDTVWGTPQFGDEIIINEHLSYVFKPLNTEKPKETKDSEKELLKAYAELAKKFN